MSNRSERIRGPYIDPNEYEKLSNLADNEDITIQEALDKLISSTINESGDITVGPVAVKFDNK